MEIYREFEIAFRVDHMLPTASDYGYTKFCQEYIIQPAAKHERVSILPDVGNTWQIM